MLLPGAKQEEEHPDEHSLLQDPLEQYALQATVQVSQTPIVDDIVTDELKTICLSFFKSMALPSLVVTRDGLL